ncbi:hypothetical protein A9Q81_24420 [Gammaproteobacteria bacterium 42_54_T18]|nr:hypothetical protein A9Q81_24420 [Gammaproteobacteria bacterium 42_54_T18]
MKAVSLSQKGTRSEYNEDACLALPSLGVFIVADGVGGGPSGHEASRTVVNSLYESLVEGQIADEAFLHKAVGTANAAVYEKAEKQGLKGMASTLVMAWKKGEKLYCFNVGDSRIYRLRGGALLQLTTDHTTKVVRRSKEKMVVTRAMGVKAGVDAELTTWDWNDADVLLLMSDGISDPLTDNEIQETISQQKVSMADKAKRLISQSIERGCEDDKTVVLAFG